MGLKHHGVILVQEIDVIFHVGDDDFLCGEFLILSTLLVQSAL